MCLWLGAGMLLTAVWHALLYARANAVTQCTVVDAAAYLLLCLPQCIVICFALQRQSETVHCKDKSKKGAG